MQNYVIRRTALMIPTLFLVTVVVFIMLRTMPGDITANLVGEFGVTTPEFRAAIMEEFGLDQSFVLQYTQWIADVLRLDFGTSFFSGRLVSGELAARLPVTLQLGAMSLAITILVGIPIGIISAVRQNSLVDNLSRTLAIGLLAAPNYWIALILISMAGRYFVWGVPSTTYVSLLEDPVRNLKFTLLPAIILGTSSAGGIMRYTRTAMLEVMRQDYVRTARAKGLHGRVVILRHALRNALIPVVTVIGLSIPGIVGGSIIIENVYSIPGVGRYYFSSVAQLDLPVVQAVVLISAVVLVFSNLMVDLAYSWLNPKIRYS